MKLTRRESLAGAAFVAAWLTSPGLGAMGRLPTKGRMRLKIPWPTDGIDPHALDDPAGALFGEAIADPLFGLDGQGQAYPALAAELPEVTPRGTKVTLRPLLVTAGGRSLDARDLLYSLRRSQSLGGRGLLAPFATPAGDPKDPLAVLFPRADPKALALALTSPVTALVPRGFDRTRPDGTGAFGARPGHDRLLLSRNLKAARGAPYLEAIDVARSVDLSDGLRAFEAGEVDVGWLGSGLHRPRPGALSFKGRMLGWMVLHTGRDAGKWGAPGVAQQLLDAIPGSRLAHLGLKALPSGGGALGWGGEPCELLVDEQAPHAVSVAKTLAALLAQPGHEVRATPRPARELSYRKKAGRFSLLLEFLRPIGDSAAATQLALLGAVDPALSRTPPKLTDTNPRSVARTLPLGVVGELRIEGAHVPQLQNLDSWQLADVWWRI